MPDPQEVKQQDLIVHTVPSILDDDMLTEDEKRTIEKHMDNMLKAFQTQNFDTEEAKEAEEFFTNGKIGNTYVRYRVDSSLNRGGISADDMYNVAGAMRVGRNIIVAGSNKKSSTFSDTYFSNDKVTKLAQEEGEGKTVRNRGALLAAFLCVFLSEANNPNLTNYQKTFYGNTPDKTPVYVARDNGTVSAYVDQKSKDAFNDELKEYVGIEESLKEKNKAFDDSTKTYQAATEEFVAKFAEVPVIPEKPREKNGFRRFFNRMKLAGHSKDYKAQKAAYEQAVALKQEYDRELEKLDQLKKGVENKSDEVDEVRQKINKYVEDYAKNNKISSLDQKTGYVWNALQNVSRVEVHAQKEKEKHIRQQLQISLSAPDRLAYLKMGDGIHIKKGGLSQMMSLINLSKGPSEIGTNMRVNPRRLALVTEMLSYNAQDLIGDISKKAMQGSGKMERKKMNAKMMAYLSYQREQYSNLNTFQKMFNMPATPENVQRVADIIGLDKLVKDRLINVDKVERYDEKTMGLPKVTKDNYADITSLMVFSLRTAVKEGHLQVNDKNVDYEWVNSDRGSKNRKESKKTDINALVRYERGKQPETKKLSHAEKVAANLKKEPVKKGPSKK